MKQISFPFPLSGHGRRLSFFLAAEEWAAASLPDDEWFFAWVVDPTVICGRNQDIDAEIDTDYCVRNGIDIVRRRSGGGAVYADGGNIMTSYICPLHGRCYDEVFASYTRRMAGQLRAMGIDALPSGRNDLTVEGRKISGGAFYRSGDKAVAHSTMLYDTDTANMCRALTPSRAKLASKGVASVEARIVTARSLRPELSFDSFADGLCRELFDGSYTIRESDIRAIEQLELAYRRPSWLRIGESAHHCGRKALTRHFAGKGTLRARIATDSRGFITAADISGDCMDFLPADMLAGSLAGLHADTASIAQALERLDATGSASSPPTHELAAFLADAAALSGS